MPSLDSETTAPSSTPSRGEALFSDEATRPTTPPSSPPGFPWERVQQKQDAASENAITQSSPPRKNAFSVLGKRKPLEDVSGNAQPRKLAKTVKTKDGGSKLVQMQMSLGQEVQKRCAQCGMEYTASSAEDRKLHDKFHKQNVQGYDVGKDFMSKTEHSDRRPRRFDGVKDDDAIVLLDCTDPWQRKRKGQAVLEIVQKELGAVEIPEKDIWDAKGKDPDNPKFKVYLHIRGTKCIGFVLTEVIREALEVLQPEDMAPKPSQPTTGKTTALGALQARKDAEKQNLLEADKRPIVLSTTKSPAMLGISRIWTSPTHRGQGIAKCLLDKSLAHAKSCHHLEMTNSIMCIQNNSKSTPAQKEARTSAAKQLCDRRMAIKESDVAFSQPTESGARLARRWTGKAYGWLVYVD
ncbi:hypothetical protein M409DRAFT_64748 [Zasmidium cellare ATCC 36951]|uniref:N-acetyltransferase domain-containing protein n=1 Tax=Zasmidium cellare ATCC 36951 TaxID=1080233 RepID=A0A6A6CRK3_ZASCE|nr:uncharacterized protein M409DRAFT_64748 [Zasmidium cellare ATCC 36951]KAF2169705.1 hypothetical protein M409DRAFT_64748 [Zasmidium cellare ATCC 36951]